VYADDAPLGFDVVESEDVPGGWEDEWRSFHHGIRVGRLWVGPPWEQPPEDAIPVAIDPGRAFGTGAHPTTRLSLELLQELEPGSLLDVGCGSGVLSIAAAKLGFAPTAVDADAAAIEVTRANAVTNGVEVEARLVDALAEPLPETDVAVANIALDVVEAVLPRLEAPVAVVSGYVERAEPVVARWTRIDRRTADGWAADLLRREL
jgi:ribosomal protein L11 methyltransferase